MGSVADWSRRERQVRYIEYLVPVRTLGAPVAEMDKAFTAALREWEQHNPDRADPPGDWCRVLPGDEDIIIRIEVWSS